MTLPYEGPCEPWVTDWADVVACCPDAAGITDPVQQQAFLEAATELLYALSGDRYPGVCTSTTRPCVPCQGCGGWWWQSTWIGGWWPFWWGGGCCCEPRSVVDLGGWPIESVTSVLIDGVALPPTSYRVDNWTELVRVDGDYWPRCQDMNADATVVGPDTFQVEWQWGRRPPTLGTLAVAALACELAKQCLDLPCEIPRRATQVTREGMTMVTFDPVALLDRGRTGIYIVDSFLAAEERGGIAQPGFLAPGRRRFRAANTG